MRLPWRLNAERQQRYRDKMLAQKLVKKCMWVYDGDPLDDAVIVPEEPPAEP